MLKTPDVGITFANYVPNVGVFDNVVNITFAAYQFTPKDDGKIDPDPVVVCQLRMDMKGARQLRDSLCAMLGPPEVVNLPPDETAGARETMN